MDAGTATPKGETAFQIGDVGNGLVLWDRSPSNRCPLYPQKQTSELSREMSALCQKRTLRCFSQPPRRRVAADDVLDARRDLFEQLQPFAGQRGLDIRESGRVTTRTCKAFEEAFPNGVRDYRENDRGCTRLPQDRSCHWRASGQNHVGLECNKLLCKRLHPFRVTGYPTDVDLQIAPL